MKSKRKRASIIGARFLFSERVDAFDSAVGLARRPGHFASAEDVHVEVKDRLPGATARINDCPISAVFSQPLVIGYARGHSQQVTQQRLVFLSGVVEGIHMLARNNEYVGGRLRVDIADHDAARVLINNVTGRISVDDFAK